MVENLNFRFGLNFWFTVSSCIISCIISMDDESAFGFLTSQNHTFIEMSTDRHQIPRPVSNDLSRKTRPAPTTATLIYQQNKSLVTDSTVKMKQNFSLILNHFVLYKTWQNSEDQQIIAAFHLHLKGPALVWFTALHTCYKISWSVLRTGSIQESPSFQRN